MYGIILEIETDPLDKRIIWVLNQVVLHLLGDMLLVKNVVCSHTKLMTTCNHI